MPNAFHMYKLRSLPSRVQFGTETQLALRVDHQSNMEDVHSSARRTHVAFLQGVDRYEISHDYLRKLRYPGRARSMQFEEFVSEYRFPAYVEHAAEGRDATFIVRTKGEIAADFIKRMHVVDDFSTVERRIDFNALRPELNFIKGAWFAEMRSANLASTGVFGDHVDRSDEFRRAERHGTLKSLTVYFASGERQYHTMITSTGAVVLYDSFDSEQEELALALEVKHSLLDRFWAM